MRDRAKPMYVASVIVPVYNKAAYLKACISSLEEQTLDKNAFEVVLVDDGSTDGSLSVCHELSRESALHITVLTQENGGVSRARNAGLCGSKGKYLFFLDSDDSLSPNALKSVVNVFESLGDACDVVAYPLRYFYPQTGKVRKHKREQWLEKDGLYPLDEYPFVAQSTMNVCVRNRFDDNILFSTELKMGEDQLFVSMNLQRKAALGYCASAEYFYTRDGGNSSVLGNRPLHAFDDMIMLYRRLLEIADETPAMAEYARQLVLYNFDWRIRASMLFPDFCEGDCLAREQARLAAVFEGIPSQSVIDSPYLGELHKAFLLNHFNRLAPSPVVHSESGTQLMLADGSAMVCGNVRMIITRCRRTLHEAIRLEGRLLFAAFPFENAPEFYVLSGEGRRAIPLSPSSFDYTGTRMRLTKCWGFAFELPLSTGKRVRHTFEVVFSDGSKTTPDVSLSLSFHDVRKIGDMIFASHSQVSFCEGSAVVGKPTPLGMAQVAAYNARHPNVLPSRIALGRYVEAHRDERIWLYQDLPSSSTKNDALRQFLHDAQLDDGVERYFATKRVRELSAAYPEIADKVIESRSARHKFLFAAAELVLASYLERDTFVPYAKRGVNQLGDLFRSKKLVYLQHGVLHAHIPWYFAKDRILFDYEVVSTGFEVSNLTRNYCFDETSLIQSGAARLDDLKFDSADFDAKRIIYAPSWRSYLVGGKSEERVGDESGLLSSRMWKGMWAFLAGVSESGMLEKYGYTLEVKLHPNFACYKHLLDFDDSRIRLAGDNVDESSYAVMITDFSSMVYDFVYTGARIMYFVPDALEFACGFNHYSKLDLPFDEGFGPYSKTADEAISSLHEILSSLAAGEPDPYAGRRKGFFLHEDSNNRKRLYEALSLLTNAESEVGE